ncbi:MAG: recombinase family protein [Eubacterium sp.]|nr:recombinase family protein [Eubacterium sp.]
MKATFYARVGNKDQLETETDIEKSRQKLENLFDRKKHQIVGGYITQKDRKQAICFVTAQPGDIEEIRNQKTQMEAYCKENGLSLSCMYEPNSREVRDRKTFFQAIAKAHSSHEVVLIVPSVGCISTQYGEFNDIVDMLKENSISVVSLNPAESIILSVDKTKGQDSIAHIKQK